MVTSKRTSSKRIPTTKPAANTPSESAPGTALIAAVKAGFAATADPGKAGPMQAYMKSAMPYYGVQAAAMRNVCKSAFAQYLLSTYAEWQDVVLSLWRNASFREERYAAIELTGYKLYRKHQTPDVVPLYEEMIVTGAWWDYVDVVAIHRIGPILQQYSQPIAQLMKSWSTCSDLWKRRTSIICQVSFKANTDLDLLYRCIEPNLAHKDFFIRKAIGWALRQYGWVDGQEIRRYVAQHEGQLSGLSRREALKNLG